MWRAYAIVDRQTRESTLFEPFRFCLLFKTATYDLTATRAAWQLFSTLCSEALLVGRLRPPVCISAYAARWSPWHSSTPRIARPSYGQDATLSSASNTSADVARQSRKAVTSAHRLQLLLVQVPIRPLLSVPVVLGPKSSSQHPEHVSSSRHGDVRALPLGQEAC